MAPPVPLLWQALCAYFGLAPTLTRRTWQALSRAQWTVAAQFRAAVLLAEGRLGARQGAGLLAFCQASASPPQLMAVVEALRGEGVLSREDATRWEEQMLAKLDAAGRWRSEQNIPKKG
jgi:hypothetical protein